MKEELITNNYKDPQQKLYQSSNQSKEEAQHFLYSRSLQNEQTLISVNGHKIGGKNLAVIAELYAIDNEEQLIATANEVKKAGAQFLRGRVYKPRTSYNWLQDIMVEDFHMLRKVKKYIEMPIISEVQDIRQLDEIIDVADIIQVGARNLQNYELLKAIGQLRLPIILKRGISAVVKEWLLSAEYILLGGNSQVILCERGIRTFENYT